MSMTNFRRSAIHNSTSKSKGKGGGNWYDAIRLPQGAATPFAFITAEYVDYNPPPEMVVQGPDGKPLPVKNAYHKYQSHRKKTFKNGREWFADEPCAKGNNPHDPKPCAGCMAMDLGDKSVTLSDKFVFGIVHLVPYHAHPLFDKKTGQARMRQDNSGPMITYTECAGRTCNFCRAIAGQPPVLKEGEFWPGYKGQDIKTEFGHRRYLEIGKSHLSNLEGWDQGITSLCCSHVTAPNGQLLGRCGQQLIRESFNCPSCGDVVIDMATDPRPDDQIDQAVAKPYPCLKCQKNVNLKEVVSCDACAQAGRSFAQLGMFDVVVWGKRQGEGTKSQMMLQQFQTLEEFQKSLPPHVVQMLGGKTAGDIVKELGTPYDFDKIFGSRTFDEQVKRLELQLQGPQQANPYTMGPTSPQQLNPAFGPPQSQQLVPPPPQAVAYPGPTGFVPPTKPNFSK